MQIFKSGGNPSLFALLNFIPFNDLLIEFLSNKLYWEGPGLSSSGFLKRPVFEIIIYSVK